MCSSTVLTNQVRRWRNAAARHRRGLNGNKFSGTLPQGWGELVKLEALWVPCWLY